MVQTCVHVDGACEQDNFQLQHTVSTFLWVCRLLRQLAIYACNSQRVFELHLHFADSGPWLQTNEQDLFAAHAAAAFRLSVMGKKIVQVTLDIPPAYQRALLLQCSYHVYEALLVCCNAEQQDWLLPDLCLFWSAFLMYRYYTTVNIVIYVLTVIVLGVLVHISSWCNNKINRTHACVLNTADADTPRVCISCTCQDIFHSMWRTFSKRRLNL